MGSMGIVWGCPELKGLSKPVDLQGFEPEASYRVLGPPPQSKANHGLTWLEPQGNPATPRTPGVPPHTLQPITISPPPPHLLVQYGRLLDWVLDPKDVGGVAEW